MKTCNECAARDREITRQRKEVEKWKARAATYKKQAAKCKMSIKAVERGTV